MKTISLILSFIVVCAAALPAVWAYGIIIDALNNAPVALWILAMPCLAMITMLVGSIVIPFVGSIINAINSDFSKTGHKH